MLTVVSLGLTFGIRSLCLLSTAVRDASFDFYVLDLSINFFLLFVAESDLIT